MTRSLTLSSVLACLVFSVVAVLPSEPWARSRDSGCAFEILAESDEPGLVQLYYDTGRGMNEPDSVLRPILPGRPSLLRFALPGGTYRALRFDPLDRDARMTLSGARIIDESGKTLVSFGPGQFESANQIQSLAVKDGKLLVETTPHAGDPQLMIKLAAPFAIRRPPPWTAAALVLAGTLGCLLLAGWARNSRRIRLDDRVRDAWRSACASPGRALAAAALLGTVAANVPVIFAGKSIVSPSFGVALLYGQDPWLPGSQSSEVGDPHKADVAALLWHHLPLSMIERRAVFHDRELPLWNRYDSAGVPLLGQGQSCFGDPLQLLPILGNGSSWSWDLKFLLAKWLFAMGIGLCAWRAFRHLPSALLLAVSASLIGFFVYRINHPAIFSLCYSPWILYCWLCCVDARSVRSAIPWLAALIGANWVEMNSGTAKEAYILLLYMNFAGFCTLVTSTRPLRARLGLLCGLVAAGLVFALLGSPVWYTFYRALRGAYTSYNVPEAFQLQPGMLIGLFDEAFYRPFQVESGVVNPSANIFILLGLLWALLRWRALLANRVAAALLISSLPALALAFGVVPPALIDRVPLIGNILHVDNTFSCALIVVFSVLSGFGWREAWEVLASNSGKREAAAAVALLVLLFAAFLGTAQAVVRSAYAGLTWGRNIHVDPFIHAYGLSLIIGAAVFLWALRSARRGGAATPTILIFALLGFGAFHWREGLQLGGGFPDYTVRPAARDDLQASSPAIDAVLARMDQPYRVIGFHNDLLPGWSIVYGIEGISGPDAVVNRYYRDLMDSSGLNRVWDWRYIVEPQEVAKWKKVFDSLNVRFYVGYHLGGQRPGKELSPILSSDMDAFESPSPWPRAFFTDSVAVYSDTAQFCSWIRAGDGRPFAAMEHGDWVLQNPLPRVSGDLASRHVGAAVNYRLTTNTTSFTVTATGPGFIVLTEAYEAGNFRVTLNGKDAPYLRMNHAFKGVYVDAAGTYKVRFEYRPRGFTATLALSAAGACMVALALCAALFALRRVPVAIPAQP